MKVTRVPPEDLYALLVVRMPEVGNPVLSIESPTLSCESKDKSR